MSRQQINIAFLVALPVLIAMGCVPAREHRALDTKYHQLRSQADSLRRTNDTLAISNRELLASGQRQMEQITALQRDSAARGLQIRRLNESLVRARQNYQDLEDMQKSLLQGNQRETTQLLLELQRTQEELQSREDALREAERLHFQRKLQLNEVAAQQERDRQTLDSLRSSIDQMAQALAQKNQDLIAMQRAIARKDSIANAIRANVAQALFGFEGKGLTITTRNGRVYVSISEKLLFASGKYDLNQRGGEALRQLIPVLEAHPELHITVEGHTDDVPMRGSGPIQDNWDLSVKRATTIVRELLRGTEIAPARITASGRAQWHPLNPEHTPEARRQNRRTEIILTPDMGRVLEALGVD